MIPSGDAKLPQKKVHVKRGESKLTKIVPKI